MRMKELGVSFEEVARHIERDKILDIRKHPNTKRYPHQKIFVIDLGDYVYLVPFVEDDAEIFLKTIIPSRKDKRVNIRVPAPDLEQLQVKAMQEGLPYQSLIASILHKYVTGQLMAKA